MTLLSTATTIRVDTTASLAKSPVIRLSGVGKVYRTEDVETHALRGITLEIESGDYVAISGPSGSGKSTLLSVLGLLEPQSSGSYELMGRHVEALGLRAQARARNQFIGFVFQSFNLIGDLTVRENVEVPLIYRGMAARERGALAERALERVGMTHRLDHYPAQLSGGQQQRVAVARAVAGSPALLLADEPTGNLDTENGGVVMDLLDGLHADGTTVCMVTHDPRYVGHARRTIHMLDGQLLL